MKCLTNKHFTFSIFDQKNNFDFLASVNNLLLKHKISKQQINPKVLSVASSCHCNGISKMAKIVYRQMATPQELPQQIPTSFQKLGCKRAGANFWSKSLGVHRGWLWMKLIPVLVLRYISLNILSEKTFTVRNCFSPHVRL